MVLITCLLSVRYTPVNIYEQQRIAATRRIITWIYIKRWNYHVVITYPNFNSLEPHKVVITFCTYSCAEISLQGSDTMPSILFHPQKTSMHAQGCGTLSVQYLLSCPQKCTVDKNLNLTTPFSKSNTNIKKKMEAGMSVQGKRDLV